MKSKQQHLKQVNRVYDTPFTVEEYTTKSDVNGVQKPIWAFKYRLYADGKNLYGKEYEIARQIDNKKTIKLITKYGPLIDEKMRIIFNKKVYDIENIDNIGFKNQELEIRAVERVKKRVD